MLPLETKARAILGMNFIIRLLPSFDTRQSVMVQYTLSVSTHISIPDGSLELFSRYLYIFFLGLRCGKVKDENTLWTCAPTWVAEGDFSTMLRCYVCFLCDCANFLFLSLLRTEKNLWLQFSRFGSIVRLGCSNIFFSSARGGRENAEKQGEFSLNHSFPDFDFHWTLFPRRHGFISRRL